MSLPISSDQTLISLNSDLKDTDKLVSIEKDLFSYPDDYQSTLPNMKIYLVAKSHDTYLVYISDYSSYNLWHILMQLYSNISIYVHYNSDEVKITEDLLYLISDMEIISDYSDQQITQSYSQIYDWIHDKNVTFININNLIIPIYGG